MTETHFGLFWQNAIEIDGVDAKIRRRLFEPIIESDAFDGQIEIFVHNLHLEDVAVSA